MIGLDTSVLACAANRFAPEHARASRVLEDLANGDRPWALPWPAVHEFLRLVTHPHAVVRPMRAADVADLLGRLLESPALRMLAPTGRHARVIAELLEVLDPDAGLPPGFETAVLLREHGVREVLSADRSLEHFGFLTVIDPLHGPTWSPSQPPRSRYRRLRVRPTGAA